MAKTYHDFVRHHTDQRHSRVEEVCDVWVGDRIAIWNFDKEREEILEVTEKFYLTGSLECYAPGKRDAIVVDPKQRTTFKVPKPEKYFGPSCQCGAKHTSFPNIHLFYCPQRKD